MELSIRRVMVCLGVLLAMTDFAHGEGFVLTGPMVVARRSHCAVRLADGRVLVLGGNGSSLDAPLASAEIYDPASGTFALTGSLNIARGRRPQCVLLDDGRVLVMGGAVARFSFTETAEAYDPTSGAFSLVGSMSTKRGEGFTAFKLASGRVLVAGGSFEGSLGTATDKVDSFDPLTNTFSQVGTLLGARRDHRGELLPGGEALLIGGLLNFATFASPDVEIYDSSTDSSRLPVGSLAAGPRSRDSTTVVLSDGRVLITGGGSLPAETFDPSTESFTAIANSPIFASGDFVTATRLLDGRVLLIGMGRQPGERGRIAEIFEPGADVFTSIGPLAVQSPCDGLLATALADGRVLVTGGGGGDGSACEPGTQTAELFVADSTLTVGIDIKPGSDPNCFNNDGNGVIPVAILGSAELDVSQVDQTSLLLDGLAVRVRGNRGPMCHMEYADSDAHLDLVCQFEDAPDNWTPGETVGSLEGALLNGRRIEGSDTLCIVP